MTDYQNSQDGAYANQPYTPEAQTQTNPDQISFDEYMRRNPTHPSNFGRPGQALTSMEHTTLAGVLAKMGHGIGVSNPYRTSNRMGPGGQTGIPGGTQETRGSQLPPPPNIPMGRSAAYDQQQRGPGGTAWRVGGNRNAPPLQVANQQSLPPPPTRMPVIRGASGNYTRPAAFTPSANIILPNPYQRQ